MITIDAADYIDSHYNSREWERTVNIKDWVHDYITKQYIIRVIQ